MRTLQAEESQVRYVRIIVGGDKAKYGSVDRVQPSCGWCTRNGQLCEYKERKKPGLRAGYGKELEQRLGKDKSSELWICSLTRRKIDWKK